MPPPSARRDVLHDEPHDALHAGARGTNPPTLGRRRLLGSGLAGLGALLFAATGCDAAETPLPNGATTPTAPAVDADSELVATIGQAIADAGAVAGAVARSAPAVRRDARALAALHAAHLDELGWSGDAAPVDPTARPRPERVALVETETALQDDLVAASMAASSGALAQALASMATAVAQRLAVL
ncbi:hypothetical protein E8D34_03450 [Nocardioides sp. GY 10113]|uniref:hypothetical protein n=1 Tax=Nocardioides sp. GY 10113 TaxID=2569761 RepID=UPI0010A8CE95|nr:hypothetical protein [Nocardioides sp. GY 10113]TIC88735.1 hypothetical protein E8D34_03450 [Nocardioides sp. GY 10113]